MLQAAGRILMLAGRTKMGTALGNQDTRNRRSASGAWLARAAKNPQPVLVSPAPTRHAVEICLGVSE